ncbi:hypothetical protein ASE12_14290 [Aeromicrobium sp. Root236]|uniref:TetR family transcriptional regulator n=1 Tax=Aeromicrobium sp. Root236 TaxID=1736498 RepID=UPI0006FD6C50|nr:TetR family transcriptional regulator [Aeromicrobium sp. Root236]KRC65823.1 hypothetical protein ASE12_14290 [Aeromicrobium sp. Root236]
MPTYRVGRETRQLVLDAAASLFTARGYDAVALSDIASAAGCSKGTVLYHFKTKVDILGELMSPVVDDYNAIRSRIADLEPSEAQSVVVAEYVDLLVRRRRLAGILRLDLPRLMEEEAMAPLVRAGAFLPAALTAGRVDPAAQITAMLAIFGALGAVLQDFSDVPDEDLREHVVLGLSTLLRPYAEEHPAITS